MALNRQSIVRGPGTVKLGTLKLFDSAGIVPELNSATQELPSSLVGPMDTIKTDQTATIQFTPVGEVTADILAALFPHQSPNSGSSLFGSSDVPAVVHSRAGVKVTFASAALTSIPELRLSPVQTPFGQATLTAIVANGKTPDETNAVYKVETATYADGEPDRAKILTGKAYTASWGSLDINDTAAGWTISFDLSTDPVNNDSQGTADMTLASLVVRARCQPLGLGESSLLAALPAAKARGSSVATANDLVITAEDGLTVTLKNAALVTGPVQWGNTTLRAGEIGFVAHRDATTGKLYEVALASAASGSENT